jgi:hypothetical protein
MVRKWILPGNTLFVSEVDRLRCPRCDWEGDKKDADAKEGGLIFYDHLFKDPDELFLPQVRQHDRIQACHPRNAGGHDTTIRGRRME